MSSPRYICRASAEMTVSGARSASATATAVLPTPVGPTITGVRGRSVISHAKACARPALPLRTVSCRAHPSGWGSPKTTFQFFFWQLDHRWPPVYVVRRQRCREEPDHELAHLAHVERLPSFDRCPARVRRGEALEPILPTTKAPTGEIGDELLQAATRLEAGMGIRSRVHHDAAAREWLDLKTDAFEQLAVRLDRIELRGREVERQGQQQPLRGRAIAGELTQDVFVYDPFVCGVLVHDRNALVCLEEDVGIEDLEKRCLVSGVGCQRVATKELKRYSRRHRAQRCLSLKPDT